MSFYGRRFYRKSQDSHLSAPRNWKWTPAHSDWLQSLEQFDWPSPVWDTRVSKRPFAFFIVEKDIESGALLHLLHKKGIPFLAVAVGHISNLGVEWRVGHTPLLSIRGQTLDLRQAKVCYWRWSTSGKSSDARIHAARWKSFLTAWSSSSSAKGTSTLHLPALPELLTAARQNRYADWSKAVSLDFLIPETLISADPTSIRRFFRKHRGQIILRDDNATQLLLQPEVLRIRPLAVSELPKRTLPASACFQQLIKSRNHLRAVVIGNRVLCARLELLKNTSQPDWRLMELSDVAYTNYRLPVVIQRRLLKFAKEGGMQIATFDLILSKTNQVYFLEMNRPGRWFFLQLFSGIPIREEIAKLIQRQLKKAATR